MVRRTIPTGFLILLAAVPAAADPLPSQAIFRLGESRPMGNRGEFLSMAWSPDGRMLVSTEMGRSWMLRRWETATGKELLPAIKHEGVIRSFTWSPDGKLLTTLGLRDRRLWDPATGAQLAQVKDPGSLWSPDSKTLASLEDKLIRLWDPASGAALHQLKLKPAPWSLAWSPDGKTLAIYGGNKLVRLWDPAAGGEPRELRAKQQVRSVAWSPDGKTLASTSENGIDLWDPTTGAALRQLKGPGDRVGSIVWSPDSRTLASLDADRPFGQGSTVRLWDPATGAALREIKCKYPWSVAWSPDGRTLAVEEVVSAFEREIRLWEVGTASLRGQLPGARGGWSPDGRKLASAPGDATILVWDFHGAGPAETPPDEALNGYWAALGEGAPEAYQAVRKLCQSPGPTLAFLRDRLRPAVAVTVASERIERWISDLDSNSFATRESARAELAKLGRLARPALEKRLTQKPPLEVQRRMEQLLAAPADFTQEELKAWRAVEVLEAIGTAKASELLGVLSMGVEGAPQTRAARDATERLRNR